MLYRFLCFHKKEKRVCGGDLNKMCEIKNLKNIWNEMGKTKREAVIPQMYFIDDEGINCYKDCKIIKRY